MIHIDYPAGKAPGAEWIAKAKALTEALKTAPDKATRDRIIDENKGVWTEVKEWLSEFSHDKCWFSEARAVCFHWQVEHFRPKKEAKDPDRDGYWWRAFDYLNYRLAGGVTNSKKGCYFPLRPGTPPACGPDDNCDDEAHLLLDPTRKSDVALLSFDIGGLAVPAADPDGWQWERADKSITRYKLNDHIPLRRAREAVWNTCKQRLEELEILIAEDKRAAAQGKHSPTRIEKIEGLMRDLTAMTRPQAEFSAVAREFLLRDPRKWVNRLVA